MSFFRQSAIVVRCVSRSTTLTVPDRDAMLDACPQGQRRQLQTALAGLAVDVPAWAVAWQKAAGDALRPNDVVAVLRYENVAVELAYGHKGVLAEMLVPSRLRVACGAPLARLERRARAAASPAPAPEVQSAAMLAQYVIRQRRDAETIAALQAELTALRTRLDPAVRSPAPDVKFRRVKQEFSKRFHPDARSPGDPDRQRRAQVFQEFWPIVEEIERSR